jgi:hypothetical protein
VTTQGLPGYDEWLESPYYKQWSSEFGEDDEGIVALGRAINYLDSICGDDEDNTEEAADICRDCRATIRREYGCRQCGVPTGKKNSYCSRPCARADSGG